MWHRESHGCSPSSSSCEKRVYFDRWLSGEAGLAYQRHLTYGAAHLSAFSTRLLLLLVGTSRHSNVLVITHVCQNENTMAQSERFLRANVIATRGVYVYSHGMDDFRR